MIGRLRGEIADKQAPFLLLDVQGVGYELEVPLSTFVELPETGQPVTLHTHLAIRDDAHVLYGFRAPAERSLFRSLLKVNGVGAKMALGILSGMDAGEFAQCASRGAAGPARPATPLADAVAALTALGYKPQDASRMVKAVEAPGLSSEQLIRAALQAAAK